MCWGWDGLLSPGCGLPYLGQQQPAEGESLLLPLGCSIMCYYTYSVHLHQGKIPNKSNKKMVKGMLTLVCNSTTFPWWHWELVELPAALGLGTAPSPERGWCSHPPQHCSVPMSLLLLLQRW